MRIVFDTNVLISALLLPDSKPRKALNIAIEKGKVLVSLSLLNELNDVLSRKNFRRYVADSDVHAFIAALSRDTEWVDVDAQVTTCRDPKDNKILELALSGKATHIVSGDDDLLSLGTFEGIPILTPREFLSRLSQ